VTLLRNGLLMFCALAVVAGCAARRPAPVVDRLPPPEAKPAAPPAVPARPDTYTVKRGDTLYSIALEQGVDWRDLAAWNQLSDPTRLRLGQTLVLRPPGAAPVAEGPAVVSPVAPSAPIAGRPLGTEPGAAPPPGPVAAAPAPSAPAPAAGGLLRTEPKGVRLPYSDENLAALQRSDAARTGAAPKTEAPPAGAPKPEPPPVARVEPAHPASTPRPAPDPGAAQIDWAWPAGGKVTASFNGGTNKGIDIGGRIGDPVYASAAGVVQYVGEGIPSLGKLVIIKHSDTYLSAYAHNSETLVKESQKVARGQQIAKMGTTGTDHPKLHFEIRRQGVPLDPLQYLPARP
jgi:lipoprotein NlpD